MGEGSFEIAFCYQLDQIRGTASVEADYQKGQMLYIVRKIRLYNTDEKNDPPDYLEIPKELVIRPVSGPETDHQTWVEDDINEPYELVALIGEAIERHNL